MTTFPGLPDQLEAIRILSPDRFANIVGGKLTASGFPKQSTLQFIDPRTLGISAPG